MTDTDHSFGPGVTPPHRPQPLSVSYGDDEAPQGDDEDGRDDGDGARTESPDSRTSEFIFGDREGP